MKKLTVQQNNKTMNFSLVNNYKDATEHVFSSPEEWLSFFHKANCSDSSYPRFLRVKRANGAQWGDNGAGKNYSMKMAKNDFTKFAK